ncbi:(2Fe-2S) ferredoxin domain-containing protein [Paenibacillus alkalitolerans]|uniref:(2Fe-2S) ferredoxin domain-containing protein n=1 Tax=Paenibacillus alkalitolerans TaxID=2799335 RepID=UPI0018F56A4E|nr:(2Fe-2S) ferredoxin domain-containing protein [Paenibacillus alkalitolerans]
MITTVQETKRPVLGQVLICSGCCCGRTDKGKPEIPLEWLKTSWKQAGLLRSVQLTISGCLGPCDLTNVACILTPQGQIWLGGLKDEVHYQALFDWAIASTEAGYLFDVPETLKIHIFERFRFP